MIKILQKGKIKKETKRIYLNTCPECGCVFECDETDFIVRYKSIDVYAELSCPTCDRVIVVDRNTPYRDEEID